MLAILLLALPLPLLGVQDVPAVRDTAAFVRIANERKSETKKKLALDFEKKFPKSKHLPDVYIQLSRVLVSRSDFTTAKQYGDKAVAAVTRLEKTPPENAENAWHEWMKTVESSARSNAAWINEMVTWQQEQFRSGVRGRPPRTP